MRTQSPLFAHRAILAGLLSPAVSLCALTASPAAPTANPATPAPKTHTLFLGADLDVLVNKTDQRVKDVSGGSFVVTIDGQEQLVPMNQGPAGLRVVYALKLGQASAAIAHLKGERVYTPENDPQRKYAIQQAGMTGYTPDTAQLSASLANSAFKGAAMTSGIAGFDPTASQHLPITSPSQMAYNATPQPSQDLNSASYHAGKMQEELSKELFDAIEITFEVSADKPLRSPYMVIVAQFSEPDKAPGSVRNWIYAQELEPIDTKPRVVRIFQGGFPPGFVLQKYQVHLYNRGQELATNLAEKRVPLTYEEAFTYLTLSYLSSHKSDSLPATPALARITEETRSRLGEQFTRAFFVKVSKDGLPSDAFTDSLCKQKIEDPNLLAVIKDLRFKPALQKGQPVEAVARVNLNDLPL